MVELATFLLAKISMWNLAVVNIQTGKSARAHPFLPKIMHN